MYHLSIKHISSINGRSIVNKLIYHRKPVLDNNTLHYGPPKIDNVHGRPKLQYAFVRPYYGRRWISPWQKTFSHDWKSGNKVHNHTSGRYFCIHKKTHNLYPLNGVNTIFLLQHTRSLQTSTVLCQDPKEDFKVLDEKSKIEEYVKHQRKKIEQKENVTVTSKKFREAFIFKIDRSLIPDGEAPVKPWEQDAKEIPEKKPITQIIIDELKHYYNGFKLLYLDIKIAIRLLWQVMNGKVLSRRERKQFLRTVADLFRLVPFIPFLVIPFMEFLLPVAIKLFPNMLPSTFEDKKTKESKRRASLKMRIQMANFLQDTIEEISVSSNTDKSNNKLKEFANFVQKIRTKGELPTNHDIMKYSKLFEDEITLENIPHDQLKAICRIIMLSPIGTSNYLRFKIKLKLQELKADDRMIRKEGIDSLSPEELQNACTARGMRAFGVSIERLKSNLKQWLELSLDEDIPASLLLLSRTLYIGATVAVDEQLKVAIGQFPERLIDEMEVKIGAVEGEAVDRQTMIDIITHEEEQIATEKKGEEDKRKQIKEQLVTDVTEEEISKEELLKVKESLSTDREELHKIKEERDEYIEDLEDLKQVEKKAAENVASSRVGKQIDSLLNKIDETLKELEEDLPDGKIDKDEDGIVTVHELFHAIQKLRNAPDQAKTQKLLELLDEDKDEKIQLDELRRTFRLLAEEDLKLNHTQMVEILALLKRTEKIYIIEQMLNKKKTNYMLRLLPLVYSRTKILDEIE